MERFSINFVSLNSLIVFYWIFFYLTQFTFVGDYFNSLFMPNSYLVIFLGFSVIFFSSKIKKLNLYIILALLPLFFDILLDIGYINYWLFAVKYISFFMILNISISLKNDPFLRGTKFIYNIYLFSFIVSIPFLLGLDILPELDPSVLRKNTEGNGFSNLYTVTPLFSAYLTGDFSITLFNFGFHRFTSFHIEPSNFTQFFAPLTIILWKSLSLLKKSLAIIMIVLSFSVTSFVLIPTILLFKYLFLNKKKSKIIFMFLFVLISIFVIYFSFEFFLYETSIGKLVYYKFLKSSSIETTYSQLNILDRINFFGGTSFNKLPSQVSGIKISMFSFMFWIVYISILVFYSVKKRKSNVIALSYFLLHGLKSINHIYPSFFLIYLLFNKQSLSKSNHRISNNNFIES